MKVRLSALLAVLVPLSASASGCGGLPAFGLEDAGPEGVAEAGAVVPAEDAASAEPVADEGGSDAGSLVDAPTASNPPLAVDAAIPPDAPLDATPSAPPPQGPGDASTVPPLGVPCGATVCAAPLVCCSSGKGGARCQAANEDCN